MGILDTPGLSLAQAQKQLQAVPAQVAISTAYPGGPTVTDLASNTTSIAGSVLNSKDNAAFEYLGAGLKIATDTSFITCDTPVAGAWMRVMFCSDAPALELLVGMATSRIFVEFWEAGGWQPAVTGQITPGVSNGAYDLIKIDWSGVRKARGYRISGRGFNFGGVRALSGDSLWPFYDPRKLMVFCGDSYTDGTGANSRVQSYASTMARLLGYDYWAEAVGGTGYTTAGTNNFATRISTYVNNLQKRVGGVNTAIKPDHVVWPFGYNDSGQSQAAVEAGFDAAYAASTVKPTLIIGPWTPPFGNAPSSVALIRGYLQGKSAQYGIKFLDVAGWVNASNSATLQLGGDPAHPSQIGHDFLGFRCAQAARALGL